MLGGSAAFARFVPGYVRELGDPPSPLKLREIAVAADPLGRRHRFGDLDGLHDGADLLPEELAFELR